MNIDSLFKHGFNSAIVTFVAKHGSYADQYDYCILSFSKFEKNEKIDNVKHCTVKIGNLSIPVTLILDPVTKTALSFFYRLNLFGQEILIIGHGPAIRTYTVFDVHIQKLYEQIFKSNDVELIYENVIRILWYLSPIACAGAGSAATTLMYIYDILNRKNLPLTAIQSKISLDFLAIFEPDIEKFVKNFRPLMTKQNTASAAP